ncbi:hypothetical protein HETIRDRAFT_321839 [Heterobasidion irregulare TC 32-1]|uniref:C2H2-type domain-containing protein n=1 Tax=Heterobasidion irregulare (strain TC 32-1) TaxID=747525 RepID=W4K0Y9_HETIT|nr:uncharacterized protein HETIRDRAFT_321839 [Heterobasidion irregulare TC 32-1]ETW79467.1 hypothetical protein HETIRDRAFT_321839 [Heterobasidion irregulare TC 32-1]
MEYTYPPTYNTQGWEESLSLLSEGKFASTDVNAGNLSASYPFLAAEYPAQQTMAQHLYEPMVCSLPPDPAWALSLSQLGHMVAGPSHVGGDDIYVPQQMLPAGESYHQAAPVACEPADGESFRIKPLFFTDGPIISRRTGARRGATLPVPSSQASTGEAVAARTTTSARRWRAILPRPAGTVPAQAGTRKSFEGNTLDRSTVTLRRSDRRKTPANRINPKAVKAAAKGKSRAKAATPVPRTGRKETPYLGAKHKCDPCRKGFGRKYERARHMKWGIAHREGSIECDQCDKTFSRPDSLRNHQRSIHS